MDLKTQLPTLEDTELANIRNNAQRLLTSGTAAQRTAAAALLPSIEAEWASRTAAKLALRNEALATRRAARGTAARSVAVAVAVAAGEEGKSA